MTPVIIVDPSVDERVTDDDGGRSEGSGDDAACPGVAGGSATSTRAACDRSATVHEALQSLHGRLCAPSAVGYHTALHCRLY